MAKQNNRAENFRTVLDILKDSENNVFISLIPPFDIFFEFGKGTLDDIISKSNLDLKKFKSISNRISSLLLSVLREEEESFIDAYIERDGLEKEEADNEKKVLGREIETIRKELYNKHLQNRYDLKISSKAPSFSNIDWDIKVKVKDSKLKAINFPYATCKMTYQREFDYSPYYVFNNDAFSSITINYSIDEIEHLIKVFSTIRKNLGEYEGEL